MSPTVLFVIFAVVLGGWFLLRAGAPGAPIDGGAIATDGALAPELGGGARPCGPIRRLFNPRRCAGTSGSHGGGGRTDKLGHEHAPRGTLHDCGPMQRIFAPARCRRNGATPRGTNILSRGE